MGDTITATPPAPTRSEAEVIDELTQLLFRVKMLEFELRRIRHPRDGIPVGPGEVDLEREIAESRARSTAKLEAGA